MIHRLVQTLLLIAVLTSCTWVKLTPEGEQVRATTLDAVIGCEKLGKINVSLKHQVGRMERNAEKVSTELQTLARNEGALMGGNAVVPQSRAVEGRQEFGVFNCR